MNPVIGWTKSHTELRDGGENEKTGKSSSLSTNRALRVTSSLSSSASAFNEQREFFVNPIGVNLESVTGINQAAESVLGSGQKDEQETRSAQSLRKMSVMPGKSANSAQDMQSVIESVKPIAENFTTETSIDDQRIAHQTAKDFLTQHLTSIGADVAFISPPTLGATQQVSNVDFTPLLEGVFYWEYTQGVAEDIQMDGNREEDNTILYGAASQFNGCEAPDVFTLPPGEAVPTYKMDPTQGPQAQLQFHPHQVELINCGGNIGFNGLSNVLDEQTKSTMEHGYFRPTPAHADAIIHALMQDGIEYICVANRPYDENKKNYGTKPVHMALMSAPAFGYGGMKSGEQRHQIEFLCALQSFRAQFQHCIDLAQKDGKPVIFKAAGMGLGVYGNLAINVAKGFYVAAKEFETRLQENRVEVRFQIFGGGSRASLLIDILHLPQWKR